MNRKELKKYPHVILSNLIAILLGLVALSSSALSAVPSTANASNSGLDRVAIDINSERVLIENGKTLDIVRGDLVTLIEGWPKDKSTKTDAIDFVGFAPLRGKNNRDDRGFIINTSSDIQLQFAKDAEKSLFEIQVRMGEVLLGSVFIRLVAPRLDRVEVSVNGKAQVLQNGDILTLKPTDKIAVKHVVTNIRGNENVRHELRAISAPKGKPSREIVFARGDQVFGRIPLQWQE